MFLQYFQYQIFFTLHCSLIFIGYHIGDGDKSDKKESLRDEIQNDGNLSQNGRQSPQLDSAGIVLN